MAVTLKKVDHLAGHTVYNPSTMDNFFSTTGDLQTEQAEAYRVYRNGKKLGVVQTTGFGEHGDIRWEVPDFRSNFNSKQAAVDYMLCQPEFN